MKKIKNPLISGYKVGVQDVLDKKKPALVSKMENGNFDFSNEKLLEMAVAGWMIYAAQLIIERNARECDKNGLRASFFQERKKYINRAVEGFEQMRKHCQLALMTGLKKSSTTRQNTAHMYMPQQMILLSSAYCSSQGLRTVWKGEMKS